MGVYLHHVSYYLRGAIEDKTVDAINYITSILSPIDGNKYYIMDPYLNVVDDIQYPIKESKVENSIWSFLIAELAMPDTAFKIITREPVDGIFEKGPHPPYSLPVSPLINNAKVDVCKYVDKKYCDTGMHDRFILRDGNEGLAGVHIGPSLADIKDKDVSITPYSAPTVATALKAFSDMWNACITNKEWKK